MVEGAVEQEIGEKRTGRVAGPDGGRQALLFLHFLPLLSTFPSFFTCFLGFRWVSLGYGVAPSSGGQNEVTRGLLVMCSLVIFP